MYKLLRYLYSFVVAIFLPFIFIKLYLRSLKLPAYRKRWSERLGLFKGDLPTNGIWIHAVSVGEVVAALPLINALQASYPQIPITVSTTTPTGSQRLLQSMGEKVTHMYMPYDVSWALQETIAKLQPRLLIVMETELWPNLLYKCQQQEIPVIIVNGRISDRSLHGYNRIHGFVKMMLRQVEMVFAQSQQDADRFKVLGLDPRKLEVTGNLKFDVQIPAEQQQFGMAFKGSLQHRKIWVAASTHAGEETVILDAFNALREQYPELLLILVPRHPDRFNEVAELLENSKIEFVRRSDNILPAAHTAVLLGDTMGELNVFYAAADIAFVGGSLVPIGGHNLLEPAAAGIAIMTGSHLANFQEISAKLLEQQALVIVRDKKAICAQMITWLNDAPLREEFGKRALSVVNQNRGATGKVIFKLSAYLGQSLGLA